jgi:hypothetical protein
VKPVDLKATIARYLLIDIERISIDFPTPMHMRVRIQGATAKQCEYIWDCLAPDHTWIDLTVEGGGTSAIPDHVRWPLNVPMNRPSLPFFAWGLGSRCAATGVPIPCTAGRRVPRSVFWKLVVNGAQA